MGTGQREGSTKSNEGVVKGVTAASRSGKMNQPKSSIYVFTDSYPVVIYVFFWDERRLGIRLRRARRIILSFP